jgi:hypothetical protein
MVQAKFEYKYSLEAAIQALKVSASLPLSTQWGNAFQINEDRAVALPFAKCPVIHR